MSSNSRKALIGFAALLALGACSEATQDQSAEAAAFFMDQNGRQEGVETLPSGVQYRVVRAGSPDGAQPDSNDLVMVNYEGALTDGTVFDSSYQRGQPASMNLDQLIPAWQEAIPHMRVGDEWTLWVPPAQGYGENGSGPIPPNSVLVFRIELLNVASVPGGAPTGAAQG
ncbi:MAG: FKBP-type peptidyl-prolyl cis-trans isomerase [Caulobacterales bacterium]|nr:FKBP-type peptidyl-prolyl cis-trans isomerase [Caulobacterales bacterium]